MVISAIMQLDYISRLLYLKKFKHVNGGGGSVREQKIKRGH